ncbi:MAG: PilZ domain-containing protein [Desulfatitalea sp.]|nr:PilZ domain-containing protein [Desulfatitalea sp.]NNJ99710.1 PilZ domain-containing protein [Desulfatitalea sp.]
MEECRTDRRFELKLPCLIYAADGLNGSVKCQTVTSNVSVGGALVETDLQLPIGKRVSIELLIQRDELFGNDHNSCIKLRGQVIRADECSVALSFDKEYWIVRISNVFDFRKWRLEKVSKTNSTIKETV